MRKPRTILPYGPDALLLQWEPLIDVAISEGVHAYARALRELPEITECVPAYASLLVRYDAGRLSAYAARELAYALRPAPVRDNERTHYGICVCYDPELGPDLESVARSCGMSVEEVIAAHSSVTYHVFQLGYQPGFAFLGPTPAPLHVPRHPRPRPLAPYGAVGIAGNQTGIYPGGSPGGWQLIGRAPLLPDDRQFEPGDRVEFVPVDRAYYDSEVARNA